MPSEVFSWVRTKQNVHSEDQERGKESSLQEQLQKRTSEVAAKQKECTDLHHELEVLNYEYCNCLAKLQQCRDELKHSQSKQAPKNRDHWIPIIMVIIATALVSYLSNFTP